MRYAPTYLAGLLIVGTVLPVWAVEYRLEGDVAAYRWVEDLGSIEVKESGPVFQFGGYVSAAPSKSAAAMTLRGDLRVLVGQVDYEGFNQDLSTGALTPATTDTTYLGITPEVSVGLRQGVESGYLEPFVGLGYRWWWRDIGGNTGYPEYYNLIYSRLGLRMEHEIAGNLKFHSTFSVDPVLWARETIDLTESAFLDSGGALVQGQRFTVKNGLRPGWTIEVGLQQARVNLTGYWQAVRIDESNSVRCYDSVNPASRRSCFQPKSQQDIFGLRVGLSF